MGRHGYSDDDCFDRDAQLAHGRWRGMVKSAIRGKRGQKLLTDLLAALDAMPDKRLVAGVLASSGEVCTLGALCLHQSIMTMAEMAALNVDDEIDDADWANEMLADKLDAAKCLIQEIEYQNDEGGWRETPEKRWERMRRWVEKRLAARQHAGEGEK